MNAAQPRPDTRTGALALAVVVVAATALVLTYVALGGGSYKPLQAADPCKPRPLQRVQGFEKVSQQLLLSALDGAACRLRVTREELALALASTDGRKRFAREHRIEEPAVEDAIRRGLDRAALDARRTGQLSGVQASIVRGAVAALPIGTLIKAFRTGKGLAGSLGGILGR